ncbi:MAG: oxygen-independent coproporphyrinogen III oxidase [Pseudobdellovibrionaceae bacterium]
MKQSMDDLLKKYDIPAPRYTSYPTVPYWETSPTSASWLSHLSEVMANPKATWSMYLHIPFCETLCTFCGCNTIITKDHKKETPYVDLILKEFDIYLKHVPAFSRRPLGHVHLGGGTPTFLSASELERLMSGLFSKIKKTENHFEASIEVDPRRTNEEQLQRLHSLGFNRISLGVQDFEPEVQRLVNRIQPFEMTKQITELSRSLGYQSVNFDLIYGLAKQTPESIAQTAKKTVELKPDRIALYSFALVPWIKPAQRLFKDEDLPVAAAKRKLYEIAREILLEGGYVEIGMDHFALPTDSLAKAVYSQTLHRNFMGYTDQKSDVLLGLGVSSISESPSVFHQNEKVLPLFEQKILTQELATLRGHQLTAEDIEDRQQILEFMTAYEVRFKSPEQAEDAKIFLSSMISDGLIEIDSEKIKLLDDGKPFLRNACLFFDRRLREKQPQTRIFSQSI